MGGRFDSDVRSKGHLRPKKIDGPGPGEYKLPGAIKSVEPGKNTWSKADRFSLKDKGR